MVKITDLIWLIIELNILKSKNLWKTSSK